MRLYGLFASFLVFTGAVIPLGQADKYSGKTVRDAEQGFDLSRLRSGNVPKVGELAPDFTLLTPDGKTKFTLSSLVKNRPVVLIFGSMT